MIAWLVALMFVMQPAPKGDEERTRMRYEYIASGIARAVAESEPLFPGAKSRDETATLLVALAWYESRYAIGARHTDADGTTSYGFFQQKGRGELDDPYEGALVAIQTIRKSQRICRGRPRNEMLGWYGAGGPDCTRGLRESRARVNHGAWLFRTFPRPDEAIEP